ncbi:MAG: hypothetical protein LBJ11_04110 [Oscillospiraceae bacterium]|jgi:hypothetical protein|nr:hypothetical protein [Oscillospiraceae bacterium]
MTGERSAFPRADVAGVSLPWLLIGTNWLMGYSHTSAAADAGIRARYPTYQSYLPVFEAFVSRGVDAMMGPGENKPLPDAPHYAEQQLGRKIIFVDTPVLNVDDSPQGRREAEQKIRQSAADGATFCLPHHACTERLVNRTRGTIDRLDDYTKMIRDAGLIPGLSCHMPEMIPYADQNGYDVETYIQIYNPMGFLMQVEIENVSKIIRQAKKPVMVIKPFAAGRCSPYVGLNFVYNTIRDRDMVTRGAGSPAEALEDIEIALAAIERRWPDLEGRGSPAQQAALQNGENGENGAETTSLRWEAPSDEVYRNLRRKAIRS